MPDEIVLLQATTEAISETSNALHLHEQKDRVQSALVKGDSSLVLDSSKALLESIFKTILNDLDADPNIPNEFTKLFKTVKDKIPFSTDTAVSEKLKKLASSLIHQVNELRNEHGAASHGSDAYYQCPIQPSESQLIVQFVDGLAGFILTKHKEQKDPKVATRIHYEENSDFNDFWDGQYEGYSLPFSTNDNLTLSASEILFRHDLKAYREALIQFRENLNDD